MSPQSPIALILAAAVGYGVGAIPLPYVIVRMAAGKDLRDTHTGNVGVMNSASVLGRWWGLGVLLAELVKGMTCAWLGLLIGGEAGAWLALTAAVLGANWPVWLKFSGGRGNTTFAGGLLALAPWLFIALAAVFFAARSVTGSAFVAARINMLLMPVVFGTYAWVLGYDAQANTLFVAVGLSFALIFRSKHSRETDDHIALSRSRQIHAGGGD